MKIFILILALAATAAAASAQAADHFVSVPAAGMGGNVGAVRFWTRSTIALTALDGAAKAADSYFTRRNMDGGGEEFNPLARPFVRTARVQIPATAALFGAEIATAYCLHRRRHDHMGWALLGGGAAMNGLGAASSYKDRVKDW